MSTQGGITATYRYTVEPDGDRARVGLHAECEATGAWKIVRPLIGFMMKRADGQQIAALARELAKQ